MQILFNKDKTEIHFVVEKLTEYKSLFSFPGLLKSGPNFFIPARFHIAYNVIGRIKSQFKNVLMGADVAEFLKQDFTLRSLPAEFKFFTKPMQAQEIALRYMYTVGSGGLLMDPGMGKSKVVLDYIALMQFGKSLIVCPKPLLFVWEDEVETHRPDLKVYAIGDLKPTKVVEVVDGKRVVRYVMEHDKAWKVETDNIAALQANVIVINYDKAVTFKDELAKMKFDFIHLDEFLIKEQKTERTKVLTSLSKTIPYRCGGSGTLINNTPLDMFAPVRFLEPSLVRDSFHNFKDRYTVSNQGAEKEGPKFIVGFRHLQEARAILESCCIVMTKAEWLKLPDKKFHYKYVLPSLEQRRVYSELSSNYITSINGQFLEVDNALVMMSKLYQVSNGFVYISEDSEPEEIDCILSEGEMKPDPKKVRKTVFLEDQPKIEALAKLLDNEVKGHKSIIWFNMQAEYTLIKEMLESRGDSFLTIKGGEGKAGEKVREFNRTPSIRYLVCQAKSVNYGITVLGTSAEKLEKSGIEVLPDVSTTVSTQIFYSLNFSLEVFLQQQDRIHRIGQEHLCNYYLLVANTPVEHRIKEALEGKLTIRRDMLVDIAEKLRGDVDFHDTV